MTASTGNQAMGTGSLTGALSRVALAHGGGGQLTDSLIHDVVLPRLNNTILGNLLDAGIVGRGSGRLALTIDSYVVQPLFFPGGNIGRLAVSGTVNDLAVSGAEPLGLALAMILEEGLETKTLESVLDSIRATAEEAGVCVITGDTKVVGRGQADGMYLITAGMGRVPAGLQLHPSRVEPGDLVILSGTIGEHGLAVMLTRDMPEVKSVLRSDAAPLNVMISDVLRHTPEVKFMRDPTRGGLAGVAADLARQSGRHVVLEEALIPVQPEARHAAAMLGLDPLEVANEGKAVIVVAADKSETVLETLRRYPTGLDACVVGHIGEQTDGICEMWTNIGGRRVLQKPYGEQLPRIC